MRTKKKMVHSSDHDSEQGDPLQDIGGEMPHPSTDLKWFIYPSNKFARSLLYGMLVFIAVIFCWGVVLVESPGKVAKEQWRPADPIFPASMLHDMGLQADPCQSFYQFSCRRYQKAKLAEGEVPPWSKAWDTVKHNNHKKLKKYLDADHGKAGIFFRSCSDADALTAVGSKPLKPYLNMISLINDERTLMAVAAKLHQINIPVFFDWEILADPLDPKRSVLRLIPGGWTLPDYTYYVADTPDMVYTRKQYHDIVKQILVLSGDDADKAEAKASQVLSLEAALAQMVIPLDIADSDPSALKPTYANITQLETMAKGIHFELFFELLDGAARVGMGTNNILVDDPTLLHKLSAFIGQCARRPIMDSACDVDQAKSYLQFRLAYLLGAYLDSDFQQIGMKMQQLLTGSKREVPTWENCVVATSAAFPELVGQLYAKKMLPEKKKHAATELVDKIKGAYRSTLKLVPWLKPAAKKEAIAKLDNMEIQIGTPDHWEDYNNVPIQVGAFAANGITAQQAMVNRTFSRLSKPVDRKRWPGATSVVSVNVFYSQELNTLYVPAGILQPPFFSPSAEPARNFGSIGSIIAQEMSHAFDSNGRFYDRDQKLHDWWDKDDAEAFQHRADCISALYSDFFESSGPVDPQMTLRQNIADISGVELAYHAMFDGTSGIGWSRYKGGLGGGVPTLGEKQLFFVSWGQTWCTKLPQSHERNHLLVDSDAPSAFRAFGPLTQMSEFARAFGCPVHSPMNPVHRCPRIL